MTIAANGRVTTLGLYLHRLTRAALLDRWLYEEVEKDPSRLGQAITTVLLSSFAAGIGAGGSHGSSLTTFAMFSVTAVASWVLWAALILHVGRRLMPETQTHTSLGELLRTTGFAAAPGMIQAFAVFPGVTIAVFAVAWVWMLAAMVVAVRQALDYRSTRHAIGACAVAWALAVVLPLLVAVAFSRPAS